MKRKFLILLGLAGAMCAAEEIKEVPPDTIVAVINGKKVTAEEVKTMIAGVPATVQKAFTNDPKQFLKEYAWYTILQQMAEKDGVPEKSPYREYLQFQRMMTLVQGQLNETFINLPVSPEEQKAYYDAHPEKYRETQAKLIYLPFGSGKSEDEVKAQAQKIASQAKLGGDFVKLVKEYSQDSNSANQNGDIGMPIRSTTTQLPETMRNAILALKSGQVSDPVRHENGYYVFRAESAGVLPYEKVKDEIFKELKDVAFNKWKDKTKAQSSVQFENEAFFQSIKQQDKSSKQ